MASRYSLSSRSSRSVNGLDNNAVSVVSPRRSWLDSVVEKMDEAKSAVRMKDLIVDVIGCMVVMSYVL